MAEGRRSTPRLRKRSPSGSSIRFSVPVSLFIILSFRQGSQLYLNHVTSKDSGIYKCLGEFR